MANDHKQNHAGWQTIDNAGLDRELDTALAQYAAVEPRTGLEERILANLRTEAVPALNRAFWRWTLPAAIAAIVVVAVALAWKSSKPTNEVTNHPARTTQAPQEPARQVVSSRQVTGLHPHLARPTQEISHRSNPHVVIAAAPKFDQFPSPRPLSEQEKILANYVARFHTQAALIARVTNEELQKNWIEMTDKSQGLEVAGPRER